MNIPRAYTDYLADIVDTIRKVAQFVQGMTFEEFTKDDKTVFAVIRGLWKTATEDLPNVEPKIARIVAENTQGKSE
jgi:uncharacterized protein with HEPN domain